MQFDGAFLLPQTQDDGAKKGHALPNKTQKKTIYNTQATCHSRTKTLRLIKVVNSQKGCDLISHGKVSDSTGQEHHLLLHSVLYVFTLSPTN